jgi:hypothetical protein
MSNIIALYEEMLLARCSCHPLRREEGECNIPPPRRTPISLQAYITPPDQGVSAKGSSAHWRLVERLAASTGGFRVRIADLETRFHQPFDVIHLSPS